jgi:putative SOS response-associated peptidase YedK
MFTWDEVHSFLSLDLLSGPVADALFAPRYNVAPTQTSLVVRVGASGAFELSAMRWGFVPSWSSDLKKSSINARGETVATTRMFRSAFEKRRCLVLVSGFYEWQALPGSTRKQPWYFHPAQGKLLALGGIWEHWTDGAAHLDSFAIVTTSANELIEPLHDRMPLILPPEAHATWLTGQPAEASALIVPAPGTVLGAHRVSERVNRPSSDEIALIEALE